MLVSRRYSHFVYGVIQSGVTTGIATCVATFGYGDGPSFLQRWAVAWLTSWALIIPVVLFAAPIIQRLTLFLTRDEF
jgi:Protein of unknown function (DUF2798)